MKLNVSCPECDEPFMEALRLRSIGVRGLEFVERPQNTVFELTDDRFYERTCCQGHIVRLVLGLQKFEILFDLGCCAIVDGYTREAVLSFAASVERFYEFWIRCILHHYDTQNEEFDNCWRHMSRQSERQIGGFIVLYTLEMGRAPLVLSRAMTELRNEVAHKGKIPSREEALRFGNAVKNLVQPQIAEMMEYYQWSVRAVVHELNQRAAPIGLDPTDYMTMRVNTVLKTDPLDDEQSQRPLEEQLDEIKHRWSDWDVGRRHVPQ